MRHVTHLGSDVSGWETIAPLLPGPFWHLKGWHLWEDTGVKDKAILMRAAVPMS